MTDQQLIDLTPQYYFSHILRARFKLYCKWYCPHGQEWSVITIFCFEKAINIAFSKHPTYTGTRLYTINASNLNLAIANPRRGAEYEKKMFTKTMNEFIT
jgi:hypothetical protein